jgi:2-oxoglutarate dehydrogenase E2 component (dihydrolipoamide succinyltransferase)
MTNIVVPEVGESIVDARVARWLKKPGDPVAVGDPLVELETDKIDLEVSAPEAGVLSRIDHQDGADVKVGEVLGVIDETASAPAPGAKGNGAPAGQAAAAPDPLKRAAPETEKTRATPAARKAAERNDVDLSQVRGSGEAGRVMRKDVEKAFSGAAQPEQEAKPRQPAPAPRDRPSAPTAAARPRVEGDRSETRERMSKRRATIARRLVEAQSTAAMLTTFNEVDMSRVMALRATYKDTFEKKHGVKLGFMSFFVKACIVALKEIPAVNAEIDGDDIVYKNHYDIGVAVGTEQGLVVPVVRDADRLGFAEVEKSIADLGKRARDGKLTIPDLTGGTFTISNGGVYGSLMSMPILNPPQSGILGMHKIQNRPVAIGDKVEIRPMMYLTMSYDHRIVDGREAVTFLVRVKECIEDPERLVLDI